MISPNSLPFGARPPKYVLNPQAQSSKWTCDIYQLASKNRNRNYLNSLWLGTVWNLFILPYRFLKEPCTLLVRGHYRMMWLSLLMLPMSVWKMFVAGVSGNLIAMDITIEQAVNGVTLRDGPAFEMIERGITEAVIDMSKVPFPVMA